MKHLQDRIAGKTLHICYNGEEHPIFLNDPLFIIMGNDKEIINNESKDLEHKIRQMIKAYSSRLSFQDKFQIMRRAGTIKYQLFRFERYKEDIAFAPDVPLLDTLFHFCRENNCYDIFEKTLNIIMDYYLGHPNVLVPGIMKVIKCEPNINFVWHNQWVVNYKKEK